MNLDYYRDIVRSYVSNSQIESSVISQVYKASSIDLINFSDMYQKSITLLGEALFGNSTWNIIQTYSTEEIIEFYVEGNYCPLDLEGYLNSDLFYPISHINKK
jgi:hypothetical protein